MGFEGWYFPLAMLFITRGTLAVGAIPVLLAWSRISGQRHNPGQRTTRKALYALTASICVDLAGHCVIGLLPVFLPAWICCDSFAGRLIWLTFVVVGFLLSLIALFMSRERNAGRGAVLTGSIAVVMVNVLGLAWLLIGTNGSPLSY